MITLKLPNRLILNSVSANKLCNSFPELVFYLNSHVDVFVVLINIQLLLFIFPVRLGFLLVSYPSVVIMVTFICPYSITCIHSDSRMLYFIIFILPFFCHNCYICHGFF